MFRVVRGENCLGLDSILFLGSHSHNYNTRGHDLILGPFPRVESIRYNFQYQFVKVYNEIPENIKRLETLERFKCELFRYYLDAY